MPDHLSIEILGVLRGTADGPFAIGTLGVVALAVLAIAVRSFGLRKRAPTLGKAQDRMPHVQTRYRQRVGWVERSETHLERRG